MENCFIVLLDFARRIFLSLYFLHESSKITFVNNYLLTVLISSKLEDKERNAVLETIKKDFATLTKEDLWGLRSLSYPIKHAEKAFYAHFEFSLEPAKIIPFEKNLKLNEDVIRYLLLKFETKVHKYKAVKKEPKEGAVNVKNAKGEETAATIAI